MRRAQANGLKLHRVRGINVSRNPKFVEKHEGSVGLDLYLPKHAIARCCAVQCCHEKNQVQALASTQPGRPLKKGRAQTMARDQKRHGTTRLCAALKVLGGQVIGQRPLRHTHAG